MQGGSNVASNGEEPDAKNVVTAINGNVLTLEWPAAKTYPSGFFNSTWPAGAVDVDYLTTKNLEIDHLKIISSNGTGGLGLYIPGGTLGAKLSYVYINTHASDLGTGYNRDMFLDHYTTIANANSVSGNGGGLLQVARNSINVTVEHSNFIGLRNALITFIGVNEMMNFAGRYNQFIGEGESGMAAGIPSYGFDWEDNETWAWGSWRGQGLLTTICCGTTPIKGVKIINNRIHNLNTVEISMEVGGPGAIVMGNNIEGSQTTSGIWS